MAWLSVGQKKFMVDITLKLLVDTLVSADRTENRNVHHHCNWSPRQHITDDQFAHDADEIVSRPLTEADPRRHT